jgi:transposase
MKPIKMPPLADRETLLQSPPEALVEIILAQQKMIEQLIEEVERLKSRGNSDSQSSSKPPSSDIHKRSEKPQDSPDLETLGKERRKPGGQAGHVGKTRKGFGRIDRYELLRPQQCQECGGDAFMEAPVSIQTQTVAQLVERPIEVVAYQLHTCRCRQCGTLEPGRLPDSVVAGQSLGVSLQAMLVWLGNYGHLSYEKQQEFLFELGDIVVGTGTLQATNVRLAEVVNPAVEVLAAWVKQQGQVHVDESPWLVKGVKEWMWVIAGAGFALFHAADTRSRAELEQMLGKSFAGCLISDDFSVYNGYPVAAQQKCLAHLRRHFKKVIKLKHGNNPQLGQVFLDLLDEAFEAHRQWRDTEDVPTYRGWAQQFKAKVQTALNRWLPQAGYAAGLLLRSLRDKARQWWHFLDYPEVPPDNNRAERSLRLAVTKRKVCGGSRSMSGFAQTAMLLSVIQTCRAQGRSALKFFQRALIAASSSDEGQPMPSLIPCSDT